MLHIEIQAMLVKNSNLKRKGTDSGTEFANYSSDVRLINATRQQVNSSYFYTDAQLDQAACPKDCFRRGCGCRQDEYVETVCAQNSG